MSNAALQKIMQEVAIIAFGRAGTADEIAWAQTQAGQNGDYEPLKAAVNQYMGTLAAANGTAATVKTAAMNGLGMNLSNSDAASLAAAIDSGSMSWADAFVICIGMTDSHGQTLDNRADAAHSFLASLATAQKSGYFSGEAVNNAVKNLLQGIGTSATSLANGKSGLSDLVSALSAQGIQSAVVDGYVKGATVFVDANGDGVQNEGEWSTTTDNNGNYVLPADIAGGKIVASGGTDIMTGKPFQGVLTAPAGSTVVNPITTLVQALVESGQSTSVEAAVSAVQQSLGLPADVNPLSYDPLAVLGDANASEAAKSAALSVQATALQVANVISQAGAAINAGSTTTTLLSSASAVIEALAGSLAAGTPVNLSNATTLTAIVQTAATSAGVASVGTLSADLAAITAASNTAAAGATSITQLAQTAVVAQGSAVAAITSGVTGGSLAGATSSFTGSALTTQVNQATVGEIAPGVVVPPPTPTTPPPSTGGGGGGGGAPAATFTVTNTAGVVTFGGTATGDITVTVSGANTVFTRGGIAQTVATADITSKITVDSGQTLTGTAAVLTGKTIDGAGTVAVTALHSTDAADLSSITATTVTAAVADHVTFAGKLGEAVVSITGDSTMELDSSAELGTASFVVGRDAELTGSYAQLNGVTVTNGSADTTTEGNTSGDLLIYLSNSDDLSLWNTSGFGDDLDVCVEVTGSVDLSSKDVAKIGAFDVVSGASLTLTAEKASSKEIAGDGSVTITGLTADTDLSGISASGTITGTVTADVNLTAVDLTKLDTLTIATGTTATVSPQQYATWKDTYDGTLVSTDTTAPTVTTASAAYDENANKLTITGENFDTLLESGENLVTDIKGRLDWSKLVWDINGDNATTTNVTFEESDISSAKVTNATTLTITLTDAKGAALEGTSGYGAIGNADTLDIAVGFAVDLSDNVATTDALSDGAIAVTADETAPEINSVTAPADATYKAGDTLDFTVTFSEVVTVADTPRLTLTIGSETKYANYLSGTGTNTLTFRYTVESGLSDTNGIAVASSIDLNTNGTIEDGATNDAVLTLTPPTTTGVLVDSVAPTISAVSIPDEAMNIGDVVTATITVANATGETLTLKDGSTIGGFTLGSLAKTNDTTYTATFTVAAAGTDVAAGSDIPVSLTLVDPAGNESTQFTTAISQNADAIDANAPNAPAALDLAAADDTGVSNSDNLTKNTSALTITGTAEAGSTVVLYDTDGTTELGSGTATGGNFSIDVSLTAGSHSITAKTTDTSGNASVASSALTVKVDATPPSVAASALAYAEASNTITVTATGLASLLETGEDATTDIKARIDWTKLTWDIGSDDTDNVSFTVDDISSAKVTASDTLTIVLASAKATALEGATGFGGNDDYLDVASDFFGDKAGNVMTHDAVTAQIAVTPEPSSITVENNSGTLTLGGTAAGDVTINLNADPQTISEGAMPSGGPFTQVSARDLAGGGIIVTGKDGGSNTVYDSPQADQFTGGNGNDYYYWTAGADVVSGGVAGGGDTILGTYPTSTPANATGLVINASGSTKNISGQIAGGTDTTLATGKVAWYGTTGSNIAVTDQVTFSNFNAYYLSNNVPTQFFGSDSAWDVVYLGSKVRASTLDGGTIGATLGLVNPIANFDSNAAGFVANLSGSQQTLQGSMQIAGGGTTTIGAGKVGLIGSTGTSITNTDQMTVSNFSGVWLGGGDNQVWGSAADDLFQIASSKGENYIHGGDGTDSIHLNTTTLATNATGFAVNLSSATVTLENSAKVAAGLATTTLNAGKLAFIGATGTDIANTKQDTLVSIEDIFGGDGDDQFFGSDDANTFTGQSGSDVFYGAGGADTLKMGGYSSADSNTDTVIYTKSTDGGTGGDSIVGFTAGATNGDILKFVDAGNTTGSAFNLTGTATKTFNSGTASGITPTAADNIWVITDQQPTWTTEAAVDAYVDGKAHVNMTGGLVLVFHTGESENAQVWYVGTAEGGTDGSDVVKLATLTGITDLTTLTTENFAVV